MASHSYPSLPPSYATDRDSLLKNILWRGVLQYSILLTSSLFVIRDTACSFIHSFMPHAFHISSVRISSIFTVLFLLDRYAYMSLDLYVSTSITSHPSIHPSIHSSNNITWLKISLAPVSSALPSPSHF